MEELGVVEWMDLYFWATVRRQLVLQSTLNTVKDLRRSLVHGEKPAPSGGGRHHQVVFWWLR